MPSIFKFAIPAGLALLLGFLLGTRSAPSPIPGEDAVTPPPTTIGPSEDERRVVALEMEIERLTDALNAALNERDRARLERDGRGEGGTETSIRTSALSLSNRQRVLINGIGEAEAAFHEALVAGDIAALWTLAADLLSLGPDGTLMFESLLTEFASYMESGESAQFLDFFMTEELWMGDFLRTMAEGHEDFLAYGLDLSRRPPGELPEIIRELREQILDDDLLPVLLAFNRGENPALLEAWGDRIGELALQPDSELRPRDGLLALAQIPGDPAVDTMLQIIRSPEAQLGTVGIRALLQHASPYALQEARALIEQLPPGGDRDQLLRLLGD